ncbi:MAG: leucyl aminopeptidase family protein [Patescibacteria group bacterium]
MQISYSKSYIHTAPKKTVAVDFREKVKTHLKEYESGRFEMIVEVPEEKDIDLQRGIYIIRKSIRSAKDHNVLNLGFSFEQIKQIFGSTSITEQKAGELFALNALMADFSFDQKKSAPDSREKPIEKVTVFGDPTKAFKEGVKNGLVLGEEVNNARILCNTPGADMTPGRLAQVAKESAESHNIKVSFLDKKKIASLKMGGVLGVSSGAKEDPGIIVMEYNGGKKKEKPIALVGKGLTFDTGGLNLKIGGAMSGMHMDMSGGAAVIQTIIAASRLGLTLNLVAIVPAVENVVSGGSYRPGDFLTTMSGKTVEVTNTDAEGRLILADALTYAQRFKPRKIIDTATLTGAAVVALGDKYSALFSTDQELKDKLEESGRSVGERVWPMPLGAEYSDEMKGTFTDLVNANLKSPGGGACAAAAFLKEFVEQDTSWAHIDIAPRIIAGEHDNLAKGSVGAPVALLVEYLRSDQIVK